MKSRGFLPDRRADYLPARLLLGNARILATSDLTPYRGPRIRQRMVQECTGASLRRCVQIWHRIRIAAIGEQPEISDLGAYTLGRAQEHAGEDPDTRPELQDIGASPENVLAAARDVGVLAASEFPGPGDPGFDYSRVNEEPPPDALAHGYDCSGLDGFAVEVGLGPDELRHGIDVQHRMGIPCMCAIPSRRLDEDPGDQIVTALPGDCDHMVAVVDASDPRWARVDNWWDDPDNGHPWGDPSPDPRYRGTWRVTWAALAQAATHVLAVRGAPLLRRSTP